MCRDLEACLSKAIKIQIMDIQLARDTKRRM